MSYEPTIHKYVPLDYEKLDWMADSIDDLAEALGVMPEELLDDLKEKYFSVDEYRYLAGEFFERGRTD